jgi:ADP-ribose pyrophosphatase
VHNKERVFSCLYSTGVSLEDARGNVFGPRTYLVFDRGDSVAAVIRHRDRDTYLLVQQFRPPTYEKGPGWMTEILAGKIDVGETPDQSIRREIREESGYEAEYLEVIGTFYLSPGASTERIVLFYAEVSDASVVGEGGGIAAEGECVEVIEVSRADIVRDALEGKINDAKTLVGVLWLASAR